MDARLSIEAGWRIECSRLVASLTRLLRDVGLAEEVAQDAFVAALEQWPRDGVPDRPGAWLMAAARNGAIDRIRRERGRDERYALLAEPAVEDAHAPEAIGDDLLALVFVTCHPGRHARVVASPRRLHPRTPTTGGSTRSTRGSTRKVASASTGAPAACACSAAPHRVRRCCQSAA